jgi:TolB-like protein
MKKLPALFFFLLCAFSAFAQQKAVTLDEAINLSMIYLADRLPSGTTVVIPNFSATSKELSDYIIDELTTHIVNNNNLTVVNRRQLELLQQELNFQMSGEVSDETAQAIGKKMGAQTVISGSFTQIGSAYRIRVQAISVETAVIQGQQNYTVSMDSRLAALLNMKAPDFSTGRRIGAGFLNIFLGAGSYSMGDWVGGLILSAGYLASAGLVVWDIVGLTYDDPAAGIPGTIGLGLAGATAVYGFIRPFTYHRPSSDFAAALNGLNIAIIPDRNGGVKAMQVFYTLWF